MQADAFDQDGFFRAVANCGARSLLIGRRALIALGAPVATFDYDFWIHIDDIAKLNAAVEVFDLMPNYAPDEARQRGRYVLENSERVDVLVASAQSTVDGQRVAFDDVWSRRKEQELAPGARIALPSLSDLIATKRFGARPKDAEDIRWLERLVARSTHG
jgi:hypothetical protein